MAPSCPGGAPGCSAGEGRRYGRAVPQPVLVLSGVSVLREGAALLADLSWTVGDGERWVVLGPNGAGKTTLLSIASAGLFPSRGQVELLGERFGQVDLGELRTRVGLSSALLADRVPGHEKAVDVVVTAAYGVLGRWREHYDDSDVARARELLGRVGLRSFADRRFGTLSEGERKRVLLARALMTDPELLLLDEPAAGLDLGAREALLRLLTRLAGDPESPPTVLVTHHVEEVPVGTTHALLLSQGRAVAAGPVAEVLTGPLLSRAFGLPLVVERHGGRFTARAASL
jgi:iron complex transport system ATP-binding protein